MMDQETQPIIPAPQNETQSVPWSVPDTWIGVCLLVLLDVGLLVLASKDLGKNLVQSAGIVLVELAYLLPVLLIFAWRRINWKRLGFGKFDSATMGLGCGLLIAGYVIILLHNLILFALGVDIQGDAIVKMFAELKSPIWIVLVGVVFAPLVEEIFFRGFLFQGFRQKYGWVVATVLSSGIFAAAHLDPVSLIPTFILGAVLAYVYHRSNSLWPGIILHFLVNTFGLCAAYAATQLPGIIPS
jgi:membrane protease YdiL (CAAX protease family)